MIVLRPYQSKAVNEVLAFFQRGERGVLLESPVGSGKTTMGMEVVSRMIQAGFRGAWFAHRVELADQAAERADLYGISYARIMPGSALTAQPFHIVSIDTARARIQKLSAWLGSLDFAVFDEAHHLPAAGWTQVADAMTTAKMLGLSATPYRLDGKGIGEDGHFTVAVRAPRIRGLTQAGYLAPAVVYAPPTGLDLSKVAKRGGDYVIGQLAGLVDVDFLTLTAVRWYARKAMGAPAIVFCVTVEHARHVADAFGSHGWRARSVDGNSTATERSAAVNGLADGSVQVLTSCQLLGEGFDCPAVSAAILLRPTESTALYLQQVGRALRPHEDKTEAVILDLVGNTAKHGMYDVDRQWDLKGGLRGLERAVAGTWRCRKCHRVQSRPDTTRVTTCSCGASQKTSGFASAVVESHPPIAGIPADDLMRMKFNDAVKLLKTYTDLCAYGTLRNMQHPRAWAKQIMERRVATRARYQPRGW